MSAGNYIWSCGYVVTLFGQVVYTYIYVSVTGPSAIFPAMPFLGPPPMDFKVIVVALNFAIASILITICWRVVKIVKRLSHSLY